MAAKTLRADANTAAAIDRITRDQLAQLEFQTQMVLILLERAPDEEREAILGGLGDIRGRVMRLRAEILGRSVPTLVAARKDHPRSEKT
jgi:hypothetical protein